MPMQLQQKVTIIDEKYFEKDGEYLTIPKEKFLKQYGKRNIYLKGTFWQDRCLQNIYRN